MSDTIAQDEGFSPTIYTDTTGNRTVGHGLNLNDPVTASMVPPDVRSGQRPITVPESLAIKQKRTQLAASDAANFVGANTFNSLDPVRQSALTNMSYQMGGPRLSKFVNMRAALVNGDYQGASREILNSKYAQQTPNRARRMAVLISQGAQNGTSQ